jgi:hypothetical protein
LDAAPLHAAADVIRFAPVAAAFVPGDSGRGASFLRFWASNGTAASASITPAEAIHFRICARVLIPSSPKSLASLRIRVHVLLHLQIVEQTAVGIRIGICKDIMVLIQRLQIADCGSGSTVANVSPPGFWRLTCGRSIR